MNEKINKSTGWELMMKSLPKIVILTVAFQVDYRSSFWMCTSVPNFFDLLHLYIGISGYAKA